MIDLTPPEGLSEADEADWWYDNRDKVEAAFLEAAKEGKLRVRTAQSFEHEAQARRIAADLGLSAEQRRALIQAAEGKGVSPAEYMRTLVEDALGPTPVAA